MCWWNRKEAISSGESVRDGKLGGLVVTGKDLGFYSKQDEHPLHKAE